jgi:hypothetical protein
MAQGLSLARSHRGARHGEVIRIGGQPPLAGGRRRSQFKDLEITWEGGGGRTRGSSAGDRDGGGPELGDLGDWGAGILLVGAMSLCARDGFVSTSCAHSQWMNGSTASRHPSPMCITVEQIGAAAAGAWRDSGSGGAWGDSGRQSSGWRQRPVELGAAMVAGARGGGRNFKILVEHLI